MTFLYGQNSLRKKTLFIELFGAGLNYSINIDSRLKKGVQNGLGYRAGIGITPRNDFITCSIPIELNYIYGKSTNTIVTSIGFTPVYVYFINHELEFGITEQSTFSFNNNNRILPYLGLGYRLQPHRRGLVYKINLLQFFDQKTTFFHYGLSVGYALN